MVGSGTVVNKLLGTCIVECLNSNPSSKFEFSFLLIHALGHSHDG